MTSLPQTENVELTGRSRLVAAGREEAKSSERVDDGDWARMCQVINDFRWLHGHWPTRFRMSAAQFEAIRELFTPQDFAKIKAKIDFITDASVYKAEDDRGATCGYRQEFLRAADWLGVDPKPLGNETKKPWWRFW